MDPRPGRSPDRPAHGAGQAPSGPAGAGRNQSGAGGWGAGHHPCHHPPDGESRRRTEAALPHAAADEIDRLVTLRTERQSLVRRDRAPLLWFVMDETVLPPGRQPQGHARADGRAHRGRETARRPVADYALRGRPAPGDARAVPHLPVPAPGNPGHRLRGEPGGRVCFDERDEVSSFVEALDRMCAQAAPAQSTDAVLDSMRKEI